MTTSSSQCLEAGGQLRLEGALNLYTAEAVRARLVEQVMQPDGLILDLGAVEACDCAGIQLLCAARKSASAAGRPFQLRNVSPSILAAADGIGLDRAELSNTRV